MLRVFKKMPLTLVLVVLFALFFGKLLPLQLQQMFYTISLIIKEFLIFLLPAIIFSLLFGSIVNIGGEKGTIKLIILLFACVCCSNFLATWVSYIGGNLAVDNINNLSVVKSTTKELSSLYKLSLPKWIKNEIALLIALISGLVYVHFCKVKKNNIATKLSVLSTKFLNNFFVPIVPLFVLGFVLKLQYDGVLVKIIKNYIWIFIVIFITQVTYILFLFGVGTNFKFNSWVAKIKNAIPPILTGFSTMSSAASMPVTLTAAEVNTNNKSLSRVVIPSTVNIHLMGDCIAIPILALAIISTFGIPAPSLMEYFVFTLVFVAAKFAVAAVPGGGIMVMLPILEKYLNFNSEMLSLIMAMYIMFDSIITAVNVAGNSAFVIIFNKINSKLFEKK